MSKKTKVLAFSCLLSLFTLSESMSIARAKAWARHQIDRYVQQPFDLELTESDIKEPLAMPCFIDHIGNQETATKIIDDIIDRVPREAARIRKEVCDEVASDFVGQCIEEGLAAHMDDVAQKEAAFYPGYPDQSAAYFSVVSDQEIDAKIGQRLEVAEFKPIADRVLECGRRHPDHYYFVHGINSTSCIVHDFYRHMRKKLTNEEFYAHYQPLRLTGDLCAISVQDFLRDCLSKRLFEKQSFLYPFDHEEQYQTMLLSTNLSAVGCLDINESSYAYCMGDRLGGDPFEGVPLIQRYLQDLGITDKELITFIELELLLIKTEILRARFQRGYLMQILIPKNTVDTYAYISRAGGYPKQEKIQLADGTYLEKGWDQTLGIYTQISPLLELYTQKPEQLKKYMTYGDTQARILLHKDFADEKSGIKCIRHSFVCQKLQEEYERAIKALVERVYMIIQEKKQAKGWPQRIIDFDCYEQYYKNNWRMRSQLLDIVIEGVNRRDNYYISRALKVAQVAVNQPFPGIDLGNQNKGMKLMKLLAEQRHYLEEILSIAKTQLNDYYLGKEAGKLIELIFRKKPRYSAI